jgi:hypothetical protein
MAREIDMDEEEEDVYFVPSLQLKIIDNAEKQEIQVSHFDSSPIFTLYRHKVENTFPVVCSILGSFGTFYLDNDQEDELEDIINLIDTINQLGVQEDPY